MWATRRQLFGSVKNCWPDQLLAGEDVPQAELGLQPAGRVARDAAGDQRLGVDDLPAIELRRGIGVR